MKKRILKLISLTVLIAMTINTVFAYIPNADGGGNTTATKGTWSTNNQGYRITVTDSNGSTQAGPIDFTKIQPSGISIGYVNMQNKLGSNTKGSMPMPPSMPLPIQMSGDSMQGQGKLLKSWIMTKSSTGNINLEDLLIKYFGYTLESIEAQIQNIKILVEPIFWYTLVDENHHITDVTIYGTPTNIAQTTMSLAKNNGYPFSENKMGGGGYMANLSNKAAPISLTTSYPDSGLGISIPPTKSGFINNSKIASRSLGYGLHIYTGADISGDGLPDPVDPDSQEEPIIKAHEVNEVFGNRITSIVPPIPDNATDILWVNKPTTTNEPIDCFQTLDPITGTVKNIELVAGMSQFKYNVNLSRLGTGSAEMLVMAQYMYGSKPDFPTTDNVMGFGFTNDRVSSGGGSKLCPDCGGLGDEWGYFDNQKACGVCEGSGEITKIEEIKIPCPVSDGHPYLPDTQCTACKGEGTADCYLCKGTGLIMIDCGECGGTGEISYIEHYTIVCTTCDGDALVNCPTCNGAGESFCDTCDDNGMIDTTTPYPDCSANICPDCNDSGVVSKDVLCEDCRGFGKNVCLECKGTKLTHDKDCKDCYGYGKIDCKVCGNSDTFSGYLGSDKHCIEYWGTGAHLCYLCDGTNLVKVPVKQKVCSYYSEMYPKKCKYCIYGYCNCNSCSSTETICTRCNGAGCLLCNYRGVFFNTSKKGCAKCNYSGKLICNRDHRYGEHNCDNPSTCKGFLGANGQSPSSITIPCPAVHSASYSFKFNMAYEIDLNNPYKTPYVRCIPCRGSGKRRLYPGETCYVKKEHMKKCLGAIPCKSCIGVDETCETCTGSGYSPKDSTCKTKPIICDLCNSVGVIDNISKICVCKMAGKTGKCPTCDGSGTEYFLYPCDGTGVFIFQTFWCKIRCI